MKSEKRLIDAGDLWSDINMLPHNGDMVSSEEVERAIMEAPTVDAVEVKHGYWKPTGDPILDNIYGVAECSVCGYEYAGNNTNYCPDCGAKMDGDGDV